ncbi:inositol phosphorylceramide synthase [Methanococcoides orientis]|uniref:phosphatase PAP2 family protein n=1 Tax=Methanococcoides orientis TaxID=2822137 RepID=UPI001E385D96|nr:phosphatase PAP2 family protein [Methanococcoides orientis]UGV40979.1 inositol phosphorylceramide synthase [Methanococcoides orientis]
MSLIMTPILICMIALAYYIFVPEEFKNNNKKNYRWMYSLDTLPYFLSACFVYMLVKSQLAIANFLDKGTYTNYAGYMMLIEGDAVSYFQNFASPMLTYISAAVYLIGFSFLLIFTFLLLMHTQKLEVLQEYTIAFVAIYLVALPFYIYVPVSVTGFTLPTVAPLLYDLSPIILQGVTIVDPFLDNCFPSLHAALSIMAMLMIFRTDLTRFKIFSLATTIAIQFTILYLGIHWITDMIGGFILAMVSYFIATRYRVTIIRLPETIMSTFERRTELVDAVNSALLSKGLIK